MDSKTTIKVLNKLIETCKDGEYGFKSCADHVSSDYLRTLLNNRSADCRSGALELQTLVTRQGGEPEDDGSASGAMHRGWVAVKGVLTGYSDEAMLNEAERGEDIALQRYREALAEDLPMDVRTVVDRQYEGVKRNHAQIRGLRDQARVH